LGGAVRAAVAPGVAELNVIHTKEATHKRKRKLEDSVNHGIRRTSGHHKAYKDNGHDREEHDGFALARCLLALFHGLVRLDDAGLLLLKRDQIVDLVMSACCVLRLNHNPTAH